jgi:hypothetical protein
MLVLNENVAAMKNRDPIEVIDTEQIVEATVVPRGLYEQKDHVDLLRLERVLSMQQLGSELYCLLAVLDRGCTRLWPSNINQVQMILCFPFILQIVLIHLSTGFCNCVIISDNACASVEKPENPNSNRMVN